MLGLAGKHALTSPPFALEGLKLAPQRLIP